MKKKASKTAKTTDSKAVLLKWMYRYCICGICAAAALAWTAYCIVTLSQLQALANGTAFLDMTVDNLMEAQALLARIDVFKGLTVWGVIVSVLCISGIVLLVLYQTKWKVKLDEALRARKVNCEKPQKAPKPVPTPAPAPALPRKIFCPYCGKEQEEEKPFCGYCGGKLK